MKIGFRLVLLIAISLVIVGEAKESKKETDNEKQVRPKRFDLRDVKKLLQAKGIDLSDPRKKRCEDGCDDEEGGGAAARSGGNPIRTDEGGMPPGAMRSEGGGGGGGAAAGGITCQCTCNSLPLL